MYYTLKNIAEIVKAIETFGSLDIVISDLYTDSRKINNYKTGLFFALPSAKNDGHKYIEELIDAGLENFVVNTIPPNLINKANFIVVDNTLLSLQELATFHRLQFNVNTIAITGSNGKTIVKEWLYKLLLTENNIVRSPKSYNSQIGVALSVWQIKQEHSLAIFEAGISKMGEMQVLESIIKPNHGIITNIGDAHSENFESLEIKAAQKLLLFKSCEKIYCCKDVDSIYNHLQSSAQYTNKTIYTWSKKAKADLQIGNIQTAEHTTNIQAVFENKFVYINIPFIDNASIENAITCWLYMLCNKYVPKIIAERMLLLPKVAMRLELKDGINNCVIINDSYSADIESLTIALDFLNQQKQHPNKTIILSDIEQVNSDLNAVYIQISNLLKRKKVDKIIAIGENISNFKHVFDQEIKCYKSTNHFLEEVVLSDFHNESILLKGARSFEFERIVKILQQKTHDTVLEINLNAIQHNYNYYKSLINSETKIMAMVKASGYGSGSFEIASLLEFLRVDYLAVAYTDEGVELRKNGITTPIMVMNADEQAFDTMIRYNLEPEIYNMRILNLFIQNLKYHNIKQPIGIHIELDTGMHRLGFSTDEINIIATKIGNEKNIVVKTIFSHFVGSDDASLDYYSRKQIDLFNTNSNIIVNHLKYPIIKHMCNSAAIGKFKEAHFNMVRLGIGLYGIGVNEEEKSKLEVVSKLKSIVSQIKEIAYTETVGYNRKGVLKRNTRIATIPIGYADGLLRKLGNGVGAIEINNELAPIVGNVCMDMCMVDITDIPNVKEGDEVIVFGNKINIYQMAENLNTIPYEILTSVSKRVKRVYYQE